MSQGNKRRKMTFEIPDDEFDSTSSTRTPEIVELVDMRREYTVALARLQLAETFPELERTSASTHCAHINMQCTNSPLCLTDFSLEPEAVVALFQQTNAFDQAFVAGRILGVDLSSLFESITERCVQLSSYPESYVEIFPCFPRAMRSFFRRADRTTSSGSLNHPKHQAGRVPSLLGHGAYSNGILLVTTWMVRTVTDSSCLNGRSARTEERLCRRSCSTSSAKRILLH